MIAFITPSPRGLSNPTLHTSRQHLSVYPCLCSPCRANRNNLAFASRKFRHPLRAKPQLPILTGKISLARSSVFVPKNRNAISTAMTTHAPPSSDLATLVSIFSSRPALHPHFLEAVLHAHGSLHLACDYLSSLSDTEVPPPPQNVRTHHLQPPQLDLSHPEASQVLANLKDIVIPALSSQLTGSTIPPLCGETDRVKYSLSGLQVTSFDLDSENVTTEIQSDTSVAIRATDASLNVSTDSWAYRMRFPPLRDTGSANFSCAGITAIVNVRFEDSAIRVTECVCTVDRVNFRTIDARLSWLYNSLAPVVRGALRRAVENAMNEAIRDALEEQLGEWANWTGGDATQF